MINCCNSKPLQENTSVLLYKQIGSIELKMIKKFCLFSREDSMPCSREVEKELCWEAKPEMHQKEHQRDVQCD